MQGVWWAPQDTCLSDYAKAAGTCLFGFQCHWSPEEATVVGHGDIGALQSDCPAPFIKSNGFKTHTA